MPQDVIEFGNGDSRVRIEGLNKTIRGLRKAGADSQDMKDLMHAIGEVVVGAAQGGVPKETGKLSDTIRAGRGATKAVVRAGGARAPYAGVQNYGWPSRNIRGTNYLTDAANRNQSTAVDMLQQGLEEIVRRNDLAG
ncbi:HK97 gp10 family phage protein [Curtobacterium sp. MCPF17_003]|uniref:HK97 gp10 family phage protein n=1 Tax=Curtobacterium sp. MCPF17_003 TaxID=2175637 RepID=UPI0011B439A8|nr:HK97 gp10 family phage protein [Curtobacterium sp. MCPF17_003]